MRKGVRSIRFKPGRFDVIDLGDLLLRYLARDRSYAGAHHRRLQRPSCVSGDRLPSRNCLPRDAIQFSGALFNDYKNSVHKRVLSSRFSVLRNSQVLLTENRELRTENCFQIIRSSFFSFSTSFFATSAGGPSRNSVFFDFCGTCSFSIFCKFPPTADCTSAIVTLRIGFVLACLIPISVA